MCGAIVFFGQFCMTLRTGVGAPRGWHCVVLWLVLFGMGE